MVTLRPYGSRRLRWVDAGFRAGSPAYGVMQKKDKSLYCRARVRFSLYGISNRGAMWLKTCPFLDGLAILARGGVTCVRRTRASTRGWGSVRKPSFFDMARSACPSYGFWTRRWG